MGMYLVPFILRPIDFIHNFKVYIIGLVSYIFLIPTFVNIMTIYSMCNLHDVSWGNRPSISGGTNAFSDD